MIKINWIGSPIALCIAGLIAWGLYSLGIDTPQQIALCVTSGITSLVGLTLLFGLDYKNNGGTMVKAAAICLLTIEWIICIVFSFFTFPIFGLVIPSAIVLLVFLGISMGILKSKE